MDIVSSVVAGICRSDSRRRGALAALLAGATLLVVGGLSAQEPVTAEPLPEIGEDSDGEIQAPAVVGPADAAEAEAFFDGLMEVQLRHLNNVGATVSLVRDGEVLFAKGYGYADLENGVEVDPEETLFRIGSVSKLFVWTTVMQLVEAGELDLHTDVAEYLPDLDFHQAWPEPVTMAHLMTHSPGLEDRVLGLFAREEEQLAPLEDLLAAQTPAQVRPPGDQPSYSNHGTALAALVVERVTGRSFRDVVQERILDPLGMTRTSLDQPLPEPLAAKMSKGYRHAGDHFEEEDFELVPLYPAGTASASAVDMAKLMIAYLQNGRLGEATILSEETARLMRTPLLSVDPAVNPSPHGFMDLSTRGVRIVGHGGDTFWFHTLFAIFPEHGLGLFVSYNTDKGGDGRDPLLEAFMDRYFEPAQRPLEAPEDFSERAELYTGEYRANRFAHTTLAKVGAAVGAFKIEANEDGELVTPSGRFVETAPRVFTEREGEQKIVFIEGDDGTMSHFYIAQFPIMTFERVPALESQGLHLTLLALVGVLLVATAVAWPGGWIVRKWFGVRQEPGERIPWASRLALWLLAVLLLTMLVAFVSIAGDPTDLAFGDLSAVKKLLALPLIGLLPLAAAVWAALRLWRGGRGTRLGRLFYTLGVLAALVFYWQLSVWNLLGFHL